MKKLLSLLLTLLLILVTACNTVENIIEEPDNKITYEIYQETIPEEIELSETIPEQLPITPKLNEQLSFTPMNMPKPFSQVEGGGGDYEHIIAFYMISYFCQSGPRIDAVCGTLIDAFTTDDDFMAWVYEREKYFPYPISSFMDYVNTISFIIDFDVPLDELRTIWIEQMERIMGSEPEWMKELSLRGNYWIEEEIDLILSLDEARIIEYFASDYVILHDGRGFTPSWIYWHDTEAYEAAGITQKMIEEKLHLYAEFSFTAEATLAFEAKLSEFLGRDVILANERVMTTTDALVILRAVAGVAALTEEEAARFEISGTPATADALRILRVVAEWSWLHCYNQSRR
jgi:hypothetical protein